MMMVAEGVTPVVAFTGSRKYPTLSDVETFVDLMKLESKVISGGARGVDKTAVERANKRGMKWQEYPAEWELHGRYKAGYIRNTELVLKSTHVVAFWDGKSNGTLDTIVKAIDAGKLHRVYISRLDGTREHHSPVCFRIEYAEEIAEARAKMQRRGC